MALKRTRRSDLPLKDQIQRKAGDIIQSLYYLDRQRLAYEKLKARAIKEGKWEEICDELGWDYDHDSLDIC